MTEHNKLRQNLVLMICLAMLGYFGFHVVEGKHDLEARAVLLKRASELESRLARLEVERGTLARNVSLMQDHRLDPDMLAEQARRVLVMMHPKDVVLVPSRRR